MRQPVSGIGRIFLVVLFALVIGSALAACSGAGGDDDGNDDAEEAARSAEPMDAASGADEDEAVFEETAAGASGGESAPDGSLILNQIPFDRLVIRTANLTLTVSDVPQATSWVRDLAARKGGFVFSSNTYVEEESEFAEITIRVPSDQYDSTILELRDHDLVLQVDREESTAQDVSQEYVDNEARLEALEETQRRFLALLSEADDVESILRIESELTNIRSQIETIKGRQSYLDQMTAYSTITVTLHVEDGDLPDELDEDDGFITSVFTDSWNRAEGFIEGLAAAVVTLGIITLAVLPFIGLVVLAYRLIQRRVARA